MMRLSIFILFSFLILHSCAKRDVAEIEFNSVRSGIGQIEFRKGTFEGINRIWYYNSKSAQHPKKVVFVLHGQSRLARNELYAWVRFAEEENLLVVAPEFSDKELVSFNDQQVWAYNIGNLVGYFGSSKSKDNWYFSSIEKLFQYLKNSSTNLIDQYILYGHSAGGQFVHRMALYSPDASFDLAIAANSGWYTLPVTNKRFPYGLSHSPIEKKTINASFQKN
jgi:poly(3-hydroxybutyrate) depolymerase